MQLIDLVAGLIRGSIGGEQQQHANNARQEQNLPNAVHVDAPPDLRQKHTQHAAAAAPQVPSQPRTQQQQNHHEHNGTGNASHRHLQAVLGDLSSMRVYCCKKKGHNAPPVYAVLRNMYDIVEAWRVREQWAPPQLVMTDGNWQPQSAEDDAPTSAVDFCRLGKQESSVILLQELCTHAAVRCVHICTGSRTASS